MAWVQNLAMGLLLMAAIAAGIIINGPQFSPLCTSEIIETRLSIEQSDRDLKAPFLGDQATKCSAYQRRVDILTKAVPISQTCGPPQATPRYLWPTTDFDDLQSYKRLLAEQCH